MPLPLPNLDTRRWADLVDEGRALIPRYAPAWTDHNLHDPGITLADLFAAEVERLIYRANRVPERHLRKFLDLTGTAPAPATAARGYAGFSLAPATLPVDLPAGVLLEGSPGVERWISYRTSSPVTLVASHIVAVLVFDGARLLNRTRAWRDGAPVPAFGTDPAASADATTSPALYIGLDAPLPVGKITSLAAVVGADWRERRAILDEEQARRDECAPPTRDGCTPCLPRNAWCAEPAPADGSTRGGASSTASSAPPVSTLPPHHSARLAWELRAAGGWVPLAAKSRVWDDTRSLTLDGLVQLEPGVPMTPWSMPTVTAPLYWIRVRLVSGAFDDPPMLQALLINAVEVAQRAPVLATLDIAPGTAVSCAPAPGTTQHLGLGFAPGSETELTALTVVAAGTTTNGVDGFVAAYSAATATAPGSITVDLVPVGTATGLAELGVDLPEGDVADGAIGLAVCESATWRPYAFRRDLDASAPADLVAMRDGELGLVFGDGVRGRAPIAGSPIVARWDATLSEAGEVAPRRPWRLADHVLNTALLGASLPSLVASLESVAAPAGTIGGAASESTSDALQRAAASLWSHEQLAQLVEPDGDTLDQLDGSRVMAVTAPERGATVADLERLSRGVPGTRVRRARAWASVDPSVACARAPGTVMVVIVPALPRAAPQPSAGLVRAVSRYLARRRVLCTRLAVVGPTYVRVSVIARVRALPSADRTRLESDVTAAIDAFFDPLRGGPAARGWPFGRDVYRSEILALMDGVRGVDHVLDLSLLSGDAEQQDASSAGTATADAVGCGNVCVPPRCLVQGGAHQITVEAPA